MSMFSGTVRNRGTQETRPRGSTGVSNEAAAYLREQQGRNNGIGFDNLTGAFGAQSLQDPLPAVDFRWTWNKPNQRGFAMTFNSARGGLEMQRGRIEDGHARMSSSSLVTHARDEVILPFNTVQETAAQTVFTNYNILHVRYQGREFMAPWRGSQGSLYAERGSTDPQVQLITAFGAGYEIYSLGTAMIQGEEHLVVMTNSGTFFFVGNPPSTIALRTAFQTVTGATAASSPSFGANVVYGSGSGSGGGATSGALRGAKWGTGQTTESFIGLAFIQAPIPGNPLIIRSSNAVILVGIEPSADNTNVYTQNGSKMLSNVGIGNCQAIGFAKIGTMDPKAYWWETNTGSAAAETNFVSRIASTNAYGHDYQVHYTDMARIIGAALIRARGSIALTDGHRVVLWDGGDVTDDTGIFADEPPNPGFKQFCTGLYQQDGQLYAEVNELPFATGTSASGRIRACKRRYDFELNKWHQISEWLVLTPDGTIQWRNSIPVPVVSGSSTGYMSAYGAPDLPFGDVTRAMHNYAVQAGYTVDLSAAVPPNASFESTWNYKFEPPPATNPYSLRGADQEYAASGVVRWPALIFPQGYEYSDKYLDAIEYGGQDTGGTGSEVIVRLGEGGRMDETLPGPLHFTFAYPLSHAGRRIVYPRNETALLFPQLEVEITRGSDATLTPQALPITIYGHVNLPVPPKQKSWLPWGRSKG